MKTIEPHMLFGRIIYNMLHVATAAAFMALPLLLLWNWLMPDLFDFKTITFWQAWGLNWLSSIIFGTSVQTTVVNKQRDDES